jgi:hypothetical protein
MIDDTQNEKGRFRGPFDSLKMQMDQKSLPLMPLPGSVATIVG